MDGGERDFPPISMRELRDAVSGTSGRSAPGSDHLRWPYVAALVRNPECGEILRRLFNACVEKAYWPTQFKEAVSVVIPKPKKDDYSRLKAYRPIVSARSLKLEMLPSSSVVLRIVRTPGDPPLSEPRDSALMWSSTSFFSPVLR